MKKPSPKLATVIEARELTPNMRRIVIEGDALKAFPENCAGGYIKLLFNQYGGTDLSTLTADDRPMMRTYTIRDFSPETGRITLDFAQHQDHSSEGGYAGRWGVDADIGAQIHIMGPGAASELNLEADWFFMVADMTALPALAVKLTELPPAATGYAIIQVPTEDDFQALPAPENMQIIWITTAQILPKAVMEKTWLSGQASVWCACEFDDMRALRQYFRNEQAVERDYIYISSYWKKGVTEDGHKLIKKEDAAKP